MEGMIKIKTILFNEKKNQKIEIYQTDNLLVIFKSTIADKKSNHHFDFSDIKPNCIANCKVQEQKNQKIVQCMKNVAKQYPDFFCDLSEDV